METNRIEELKRYFEQRMDIAFAFLYGSQANGNATRLSDVDIGVYFYPGERHPVEFEKEIFYEAENAIWGDLQRILKKEVELLVLNRVSASVAASAIRGIPLVIRDWGLYLAFMEVVTDVAEDFIDSMIRDFKDRMDLEKRDSSKTY
jgi:predicted nucleotidyltransferase